MSSIKKFLKEQLKSFISGNEFFAKILLYFCNNLKNLKYDYETLHVFKKVLKKNSNCIDVGSHKGDILKKMIKYAPNGIHMAFEPLPDLHKKLKNRFGKKHKIYSFALCDKKGFSTFNFVTTNPAYSGLKKRSYDYPGEKEKSIEVETDSLDNIIPENFKIDLIKIDVEGGELQVLQGAEKTIKKYLPYIIFEHGIGAADHYGTKPEQIFDLLTGCGLKISLMEYFLAGKEPLDKQEFCGQFNKRYNYYFIACP